jgi:hypothetical protein
MEINLKPGSGPSLKSLLEHLSPKLNDGAYVFCRVPNDYKADNLSVLAVFREAEGKTLVIDQQSAAELNFDHSAPMSWITLEVHSSLEAVGLTATVSAALAEKDIACNVIAAYYHDHLFIPQTEARRAMETLNGLRMIEPPLK